MRAAILPLAFTAAVIAGCAAESRQTPDQETASYTAGRIGFSDRDLTLQAPPTPALEVASPVELSRPVPAPTRRPWRLTKPAPAPAAEPVPEPVPEASPSAQPAVADPTLTVAEVLAEPAPVEDEAVGVGRELEPGKTVTVIPASSGPSLATDDPSWAPAESGRGMIIGGGGGGRGGTCRPRGGVRGIGIAGRIPIGVPGRRLR